MAANTASEKTERNNYRNPDIIQTVRFSPRNVIPKARQSDPKGSPTLSNGGLSTLLNMCYLLYRRHVQISHSRWRSDRFAVPVRLNYFVMCLSSPASDAIIGTNTHNFASWFRRQTEPTMKKHRPPIEINMLIDPWMYPRTY